MPIRSENDVSNALDGELSWRKFELTQFKFLVESEKNDNKRSTLLRAGTALMYAHWEGFVKRAGEIYIEFLTRRRLKYIELNNNLIALCKRKMLETGEIKLDAENNINLVQFMLNGLDARAQFPRDNAINTRANLNSGVLKNIILYLGLDYAPFETSEHLLDQKLLASRNSIAHGRYVLIDYNDYADLHSTVIECLENIKSQIENAVILKTYKR